MSNVFDTAKLGLLGLFVVASLLTIAYQAWYIWPMKKCEGNGDWWSAKYHECATPIPIWRITGRLPAAPQSAPKHGA
jgi:hypothetical protein